MAHTVSEYMTQLALCGSMVLQRLLLAKLGGFTS